MTSKQFQNSRFSVPTSRCKYLIDRTIQSISDPRIIRASLIYRLAQTRFRFWIYPAYWKYLIKAIAGGIETQNSATIDRLSTPTTSSCRYIAAIPNQWAGIGHQFTILNTALIFAKQYNLQFVYYPLSGGWDEFLGLNEGEIQYSDLAIPFTQTLKDESLRLVNLPRTNANSDVVNCNMVRQEDPDGDRVLAGIINSIYPDNNIVFHLQEEQNIYDQTSTADILRKKYWARRDRYPIANDFDSNKINVAVHVRRGDVVKWKQEQTANWQARWLDNSYFINVLIRLKEVLQNKLIAIHVYSQGELTEFAEFNQFSEVTFHINEDAFQTFHGMVLADILVTSPSDFSYIAGILSQGIKVAKLPYWHFIPQNDEWIHVDESSNFNLTSIVDRFSK